MKLIVTLNEIEHIKGSPSGIAPRRQVVPPCRGARARPGLDDERVDARGLAAAPAETSPDEDTFLDYLRRHSLEAPSGSLLRAFAQAGLRRAMGLAPELSGFGYRVTRDRDETPEEAKARFLENRAEMFGEHGFDEFIRAAEFLSKFGRRKSMNRKRSSYGLKHDAEREAGDYVANGNSDRRGAGLLRRADPRRLAERLLRHLVQADRVIASACEAQHARRIFHLVGVEPIFQGSVARAHLVAVGSRATEPTAFLANWRALGDGVHDVWCRKDQSSR